MQENLHLSILPPAYIIMILRHLKKVHYIVLDALIIYRDYSVSVLGPLAVGVPGELKGYWAAYKRFGKLPWKDLIQPSIDLCEQGYKITLSQYDSLVTDEENIKKDTHLK